MLSPFDLPGPDRSKLRSEPRSVLERRSPSPQTSGSPQWAAELAPIPSSLGPISLFGPIFEFPFPELDSPGEDRVAAAAALAESGRVSSAIEILARLNHPFDRTPFARTTHLLKEALLRVGGGAPPLTAADVALRAGAHRSLSAATPAPQFSSFTCAQAILEAAGPMGRVHVVDFDLGLGAHWAALLPAEFASLRITGWAGDPVESELAKDSLLGLARVMKMPLQVNVNVVDFKELTAGVNEVLAVRVPPWAPPGVLRLVKQLRPKIVVCVDQGEGDLTVAVRTAAGVLDAVAAAGVDPADVSRIEQHWVGPRIERVVAARCGGGTAAQWREVFLAAGFEPLELGRFGEMQAAGLVRRSGLRGFHVERRGAELALSWKGEELATVAAWR